jgi:hypothetical protein
LFDLSELGCFGLYPSLAMTFLENKIIPKVILAVMLEE